MFLKFLVHTTLVSPRGNNGNDYVFECLVNYLAKPKKVIAGTQDAAEAGAKAALASRTNTLLSFPMLYFMIYSAHINFGNDPLLLGGELGPGWSSYSLWVGILLIIAIEWNAIFGKMRKWLESVKAVIHSGLILTVFYGALVHFF